jgi:hypothetical protein
MMALKTKSPVYPAYIDGTLRKKDMLVAFGSSQQATLAFGPPVALFDSAQPPLSVEQAADRIRSSVERLKLTTERQIFRKKRRTGAKLAVMKRFSEVSAVSQTMLKASS